MVDSINSLEDLHPPRWYADCDPPEQRLGSGGGTVHLLLSAWHATAPELSFHQWLRDSRKIMIHGGGQSRRQPAYAAPGKPFIPVPVQRWAVGQRLTQNLLDMQAPVLERVAEHTSSRSRLLIGSGDVLLRFAGRLPVFPDVDILAIGLWVTPEQARNFGVFFCPRENPRKLSFFRQKPSIEEIKELSVNYLYMIDIGVWLLSEKAVDTLLKGCGWSGDRETLADFKPRTYELYSDFGLGLGSTPTRAETLTGELTSAVIPLADGEFHHFGTSRDLIETSCRLQNLVLDQRRLNESPAKMHPDIFQQNAKVNYQFNSENHCIWIENSHVPASWQLTHEHLITGIPANQWQISLPPGICIDMMPIGEENTALRVYHIDDSFRGHLGDPQTPWLGQPAEEWFAKRNITLAEAGLDPRSDIQYTPLFPLLQPQDLTGKFVTWMFNHKALSLEQNRKMRRLWLNTPRIAADQIGCQANLNRLYQQRNDFRRNILPELLRHSSHSIFYRLDLKQTAALWHAGNLSPPKNKTPKNRIHAIRHCMFKAEYERLRHSPSQSVIKRYENQAFRQLRDAILEPTRTRPLSPACTGLEDQIVWARSPARLDLAGGWSDTPPFCILNGGSVINLAVNLNGQPPLQVFIRRSPQPSILLRSIDLGVRQKINSYRQLEPRANGGDNFAIVKAALALCGFHPHFNQNGKSWSDLPEQLRDFGGGIEISLLAAIPKGSGLGTSSILAATVLGALNEFSDLQWQTEEICTRVLVLEQMLSTGGGWQDQYGGALPGIKLLETVPDTNQVPLVKWLPEKMIIEAITEKRLLLYYTGITRMAKDILHEIVRGMFLNCQEHLAVLNDIKQHAEFTPEIIQRADWPDFCEAIDQSWKLNQKLDAGVNPRPVQNILSSIQDYLEAAKLLGAGGGGYLLLAAKDSRAAARITKRLQEHPPNPRARFVDLQLSPEGLQVTRS